MEFNGVKIKVYAISYTMILIHTVYITSKKKNEMGLVASAILHALKNINGEAEVGFRFQSKAFMMIDGLL